MTATERPTVLVTEPIHQGGIDTLQEFATVIRPDRPDEPSILAVAPAANAILVRVAPITAAVIDAAPNLRCIQKHGVGVDSIDVDHATRRGIPVCFTPEANAASVAEFTVAAALAFLKRIPDRDRLVRAGGWRHSGDLPAHEIDGRTVGIIGSGRVGLRVLRAFTLGLQMQGLVYDPFVPAQVVRDHGGQPVDTLQELLQRADIVTLHTPLTPDTRHLINAERLSQMRPGAILVNTCRGPVVDESRPRRRPPPGNHRRRRHRRLRARTTRRQSPPGCPQLPLLSPRRRHHHPDQHPHRRPLRRRNPPPPPPPPTPLAHQLTQRDPRQVLLARGDHARSW